MFNIAFITDEKFILPISVAIKSLIDSNCGNHMRIHLFSNQVSESMLNSIKNLETSDIEILIHKVEKMDAFPTDTLFSDLPANVSSLVKFYLPELLSDVDLLLYLDGDILIRKDLSEFFNINLNNNVVAAVRDKIADWHLKQLGIEDYFNSGVMLLNLKLMREENYTQKLIEYRKNGINKFMDQDAFNVVCSGSIKFIDFKYNTMYSIMENNSPNEICDLYKNGVEKSYAELIEEAIVLHFSSNKKPWKYIFPGLSLIYKGYLDQTIFKGTEFDYQGIAKDLMGIQTVDFNSIVNNKNPFVSIIVPVRNMEKYIERCLNSLVNQTLKNIEIIIVDDASSDKTLEIISRFQKEYQNIKVCHSDVRIGTCAARKNGGLLSNGDYIMFVDADDELELSACEELYTTMLIYGVDIIQFKTSIINDGATQTVLKDFDAYINKSYEFLRKEDIIEKEFIQNNLSHNLWNRIYKRSVILESFEHIAEGFFVKTEDFYLSLVISFFAKNMLFVDKQYYKYHLGIGITAQNNSISYDKFKEICTGIDVVNHIAKFLSAFMEDKKYLRLTTRIFEHSFKEMNWWIKFVCPMDFEQCLEYGFSRIDNLIESSASSRSMSEAFASALDVLYKTILIRRSCYFRHFALLVNKIESYKDIFDEKSDVYHNFIMKGKDAITVYINIINDDMPYLAILIESIKKNALVDSLYNIYIFGNGLYHKYMDKIKQDLPQNISVRFVNNCIEVSNLIKQGIDGNLAYKLHATNYLAMFKKILFISYDNVVLGDLRKLYDININDRSLGVLMENTKNTCEQNYFGTNILLINTSRFLIYNIKDLYKKFNSRLSEKEFFNCVFKNDVCVVNEQWCAHWNITYNRPITEFKIIHWGSAIKPWNAPERMYAEIFWKYARQTSFYEEIIYKNIPRKIIYQTKNINQQNSVNKNKVKKNRSLVQKFISNVKEHGFCYTMKKVFKYIFRKGQ